MQTSVRLVLRGPLGPCVRNVRVGFATNSSSLQALAVWTNGPRSDDYSDRYYPTGDSLFFGEEDFRLQTEEHKRVYMAAALVSSLGVEDSPARKAWAENFNLPREQQLSIDDYVATRTAALAAEQLAWCEATEDKLYAATGVRFKEGTRPIESLGVDGHSDFTPPLALDGSEPNLVLYREITDWIARDPSVVILGGADNGAPYIRPQIAEGTELVCGRVEDAIPRGLARYDEGLGCWVVFNPGDGTKVHLDLSVPIAPSGSDELRAELRDDPSVVTVPVPWINERAMVGSVPELLDVSITDYCEYGCPFCYRGSTVEGQHAGTDYLRCLAQACGKAGVFEVAIGGGEPTEHPDFVEILRAFREAGVVPNFTTRNVAYLRRMATARVPKVNGFDLSRFARVVSYNGREDDKTSAFQDLFGAVAISVDDPEDAQRAIKALAGELRGKFCLQYIVGQSSDTGALERILRIAAQANVPVTLLGFKHTERGAGYGDRAPLHAEGEEPWWVRVVDAVRSDEDLMPLRVGIDTVLAQKGGKHLIKRGLDPRCLVPHEGVCSAFVNAVRKTAHTSSYDKTAGVPLVFDTSASTDAETGVDALLEAWALVRNGGSGSSCVTSATRRSLPVLNAGAAP